MPKKYKKAETTDARKKIDFSNATSFHEHEDDHHCSSSYRDESIAFHPKDLKQKMMIATNILIECKENKQKLISGKHADGKSESMLNKLKSYTNLPTAELRQINNIARTRDRSFEKALKDVKAINPLTLGLLAEDIRNMFLKFMLKQKTLPTKIEFLRELKTVSSKYTNETIPIYRLIKNKLVEYHHFNEFSRYILTEHPERVYERALYLSNIKQFRSQDRNFAYIEVRRITPRSTTSGFIAGLAAFPNTGKLEKFFTKDSAEMIAKKWLQLRILPLIEQGTVVVLSQPKKSKKLSVQSSKADFMSWLDENRIPYGKNPHTAELYCLYKKFKSKVKETGIYDHIFHNVGLKVLRCPVQWNQLNFFKVVWAGVEVMDAYHTGRLEVLKQQILQATTSLTDLNETEASLVKEECKMWKEDCQMEEILENVLEMAKNGNVATDDFPKDCYGDITEHYETRVGEIVWDI